MSQLPADDPNTTLGGLTQASGNPFVKLVKEERDFILLIAFGFFVIGATYQEAWIARWIGFILAGYSAVANDSIQTIGTFIASNRKQPWWTLWLYIGGIFVVTVTYSWVTYDGDVSYQRLSSKGFDTTPESFTFLQVAAPLFLMILTRMRMPVSTSFLLLTSLATDPGGPAKMLVKSLGGYGVAFVSSIILFFATAHILKKWIESGPAHSSWRAFQWLSSGALWSFWVMQDAANIAVYLPRQLDLVEFAAFTIFVFLGLGMLFKVGGARVQGVVDEKSSVEDVRMATVIDLLYAVIIYIFKEVSEIPMSTTWVFIGLLAGREVAMAFRKTSQGSMKDALRLMMKDILYVFIGLLVSVVIALAANDNFRNELFGIEPEGPASSGEVVDVAPGDHEAEERAAEPREAH